MCTHVPSHFWQTPVLLSKKQKQKMKLVMLAINLISDGFLVWFVNIIKYHHEFCWLLFWKTLTEAEGTTMEILLWANPAPSPVATFDVRGQPFLREALISWWPTGRGWKSADTEVDWGGLRPGTGRAVPFQAQPG